MNVQFRDPISDTERGSENDIKTGRDAGARPMLTEVMIIHHNSRKLCQKNLV